MDPLIREYLRGSERAKDLLVQRYCPDEKSLRKRFPDLDPGDALSEAMLAIDRALPGVDWGNAPAAYLAGAVNERLRSKSRDARRHDSHAAVSLDATLGDDGTQVGEMVSAGGLELPELASLHSDLAPALSRLRPRQRRVYILSEGARLCVPMIASQLRLSRAQVAGSLAGATETINRLRSFTNGEYMFCENVESRLLLQMPPDYRDALRALAEREGTNASQFLRECIRREARRTLKRTLPPVRKPGRKKSIDPCPTP